MFYYLTTLLPLSMVYSYKTYSSLDSIVFTNLDPNTDSTVHSEYFYGRCATKFKILLTTKTYESDEIKGNLILRGWLDIKEMPTCVYVRAKSHYSRMVRYKPMMFSMCLGRIVYHYAAEITIYYFFEWFIPIDMKPDIKWELFFYKLYPGVSKKHRLLAKNATTAS